MSVLYLLTAPPPPTPGTDAVYQDVDLLRRAFPSEAMTLAPQRSSTRRVPKQLYGLHNVHRLRRAELAHDINHVFFSKLYAFPALRLLRNPLVYTVTASLDGRQRPRGLGWLRGLHRIIVSNDRDARVLSGWGLANHTIVPPGIDTAGITTRALALDHELNLLMASAPWNVSQFASKGIDALLAAAQALPFLRLILLWRGTLPEELQRRIDRMGIGARVEVVNRKVNINDYLKRVHAAIVLAEDGGLVKAYPHSLVEALAAGKPVLLNSAIAMSDYVSINRCGVVLPDVSSHSLVAAINELKLNYSALASNAAKLQGGLFSIDAMVENYRRVYHEAAGSHVK